MDNNNAFKKLFIYHENCPSQSSAINFTTEEEDENQDITVILSTTIPSVAILGFLIAILIILGKKWYISRKTKANQKVIVHQNDLYGNLTNQEYFDQRYDTKVTDTNQYYDGEEEEKN